MGQFNRRALMAFGDEHRNMDDDAPNANFDKEVAALTNYLDWQVIQQWTFARFGAESWKKLSVLDVGAGKGRMTRRFKESGAQVVAIEPYEEYYNILLNSAGEGAEVARCTLSDVRTAK